MKYIKMIGAILGIAMICIIPAHGAQGKNFPQPFPFGTQRPTSMTYLIIIDGQSYEDYTVTLQYDSDGQLLRGDYTYGPNSGILDYHYKDGKLVERTDSLLNRNVYFLYDENGKIISADDKLEKGLGRDVQINHDITYHYDQDGRLSYAEYVIKHSDAQSGEAIITSMYVRFNYGFNEYLQWQVEGPETEKV